MSKSARHAIRSSQEHRSLLIQQDVLSASTRDTTENRTEHISQGKGRGRKASAFVFDKIYFIVYIIPVTGVGIV